MHGIVMRAVALSTAGLLAFAAPAHAEWSGEGDLGLVIARGNSDTDTVSGKLAVKKIHDRWEHNLGLAFLRSNNQGVTNAERYALTGQSNFAVDDNSYYFGSFRYEDDRFSGFDYQSSVTAGYGQKFIDTEVSHLSGELGIGYRTTQAVGASAESDAIVRAAMKYSRELTDTTTLTNDTLVESGENNTFAQNVIGLGMRINSSLAMKLGVELRYNSEVLPGLDKTDTITTVNLNYKF